MSFDELRARFRRLYRKAAPGSLSRDLIARLVAQRLQAQQLGKLEDELARHLAKPARGQETRRRIKTGSVLVREHEGISHEVVIVPGGYLWNGETHPSLSKLHFAWEPQGRRKVIVHQPDQQPRLDHDAAEPILTMVAQARRWMAQLIDGSTASTHEIAIREGVSERNIRKLLPLACLSPKIISAIADGTAPANLTVSRLCAALPHDWAIQEHRLLVP